MSIHIAAKPGEVAETVLLPGDPLRAKFIAETYLQDVKQITDIRNMLGFTGTYKGTPVTVQGTGMGMPSIGIYTHELICEFGCKNLVRIGTAGSFREEIGIGDVVMALAASTDSGWAHTYDLRGQLAPTASWELVKKAEKAAGELGIDLKAGNIVTCDVFYEADPDWWKRWARLGVLGVEMEAAALYMNAAFYGANALALVTMSDHFVTGEAATVEQRTTSFTNMMEIALTLATY
ncbi:MAG: purine-nucleoside phosphorylase [Clostridiales Family XIII bacterium]|jgi:purine-nucleoside phosphorylase|nr:purine-nucleoside phosphorylase [Clostridiales Family XIII bacterium]